MGRVHSFVDEAEHRLKTLKQIGGLVEREWQTGRNVDLSLRERLWLWRNGFVSEAGVLFDLSEETVDRYLSNYQRDVKTITINGKSGRVLDDKLLFHTLLTPEFEHLVPRLYYYRTREGTYPVDTEQAFDDFVAEAVTTERPLVVKPRTGGGGEGVDVISASDIRESEGAVVASSLHAGSPDTDRLLYEHVDQAAYADSIFPGSTNTIRVVTMIDPRTNEPFVARAAHRFGSGASAPVDNWSSGGLSAQVNRETGRLTGCLCRAKTGEPKQVDVHPETNERITGTVIPNWDSILETIRAVSISLPHLPYIGWDVVVTDESPYCKIIEGNRYSDVTMLQADEPLLDDPRVRRFYEYHGVI